MVVQVFEGVLQSDDVVLLGGVDPVYQAGQRRGFSASGRAGDENHAFGVFGKGHDGIGNPKLGGIWKLKGDDADDGGQRATLLIGTHPETGKTGNGKRKIIVAVFQEGVDGVGAGEVVDLPDESLRAVGHQPFPLMKKNAVDPVRKGKTGDNKDVGSPDGGGIMKNLRGVYGCFTHRFYQFLSLRFLSVHRRSDGCPASSLRCSRFSRW